MPRHVLIMGAGLGGLALALSLAQRQIKSTIFEIRPAPSSSGGSITLAANALRALALGTGEGVYHKIRDTGYVYERMAMTGDDGYRYGELCVGEEGEGGFPAVRIMRGDLHRILLDECEKAGVVMEFGKKAREIKEDSESVTISFEDGQKATGDILVGADGIHSQARRFVLGDASPTPVFSKTCVVNGFVLRSKVITPTPAYQFPSVIVSPSGFLMAIPIDPKGEQLAWGINTSIEEDKGREGWDKFKESGEAARFAKANYGNITTQPLRSLLDQIEDDKVQLWAPYSIPDLPTYYRGRVCLIGDAAHALPPNGQGSAMAFEDAAFLARLLESEENWSKGPEAIFKHFESVRKPRMDNVRKMSAKMGGTLKKAQDPNSWAWWAKKWGIWLFFTVWNRGVVRTKGFSGYKIVDQPIQVPAL